MSALIAFTGPENSQLLTRMMAKLSHRGGAARCDDNDGSFASPHASIAALPGRRCTTVGNLQTGCYRLADQRVAFSGFGFGPLPKSLAPELLSEVRGSFALAWIENDGTLHVARDAVGTQSLYYGRVGDRWLVATEPKAITSELEFSPRIRPSAIAQYLTFSFVPERGTMLESLYQVEAGSCVTFRHGQNPSIHRYFKFEEEELSGQDSRSLRSETDWIRLTRQRVSQAVIERLPRTDEVAVTLSGGLDSSIIASEVARHFGSKTHTFSIHFGPKYPNELDYARAVAERIGSQHHEVFLDPKKFLGSIRQMIWHLDEPIGDPITQPNFEVARIIGDRFTEVFNGEGGDPLFGGPKNLTMMLQHWYSHPNRPANFREQAYLASYRRAYEDWSRLLAPKLREQVDVERDLEGVLTPYMNAAQPTKFLNKLMAINIRLKGAGLILPKVDRMMAAHDVTPLSPLFDDELTKLSFQMPTTMKLRSGIEKWVLKAAFEDQLPRSVVQRPKSGMRVPVHHWFQKELRRYTKKTFTKKAILEAGLFDPDRVKKLIQYDTLEGPGRYGLRLWMLLTLEIWRQQVIVR